MGERIEVWYPPVLGVVAAIAYLQFLGSYSLPETTKDLLAAVINLAAIAIGFLATVKSLLVSLSSRADVAWLIKGEFFGRFQRYVFQAIYAAFVVAIASAVLLLLLKPIGELPWWPRLAAAYVGLVIFTGAAMFRVISVFALVLQVPSKDD